MTDPHESSGMDDVFRTLSDPSRRSPLVSLNRNNGQRLRQLCAGLAMTRQSVSEHVAVLEAARLVTTRQRGLEKPRFLSAAPINVKMASEPLSNVTFDLEPMGELVRLTVTHAGFEPGSSILAGLSNGWPGILASLKSLLETGEPLAFE